MELEILIGDVRAGFLRHDGHHSDFVLAESYRAMSSRPVLGQAFEDDLAKRWQSRVKLPPFFSNLLPEGALRTLIARRAGVHEQREFFLLTELGEDLPGAITARRHGVLELPADAETALSPSGPPGEQRLRFSLAGVQLKFSVVRARDKLTLPVSGAGGNWILKLPDARYDDVPANEHSTMTWARESGIETPPFELVPVARVDGLPAGLSFREPDAFLIQRFDRVAGDRVHIEDFAQVLGVYPTDKYEHANYETLASIVWRVAGRTGLEPFIRRLVFAVASANADAHLKNWSLIYRDGVHAELSPAYDQVSTIRYLPDDALALNLARSKQWEDVKEASFARLGSKIGVDPQLIVGWVQDSVTRSREAWHQLTTELRYTPEHRAQLARHWQRVPLLGSL